MDGLVRIQCVSKWHMVKIRVNSDSPYSVKEENDSFAQKLVSPCELCQIKRHLPELLVIYRGIILLNIFFQTLK